MFDDDGDEAGGGRNAVLIGFGGEKPESELPMLMRALARAMKAGAWERAAKAFTAAIEAADDGTDDHDSPCGMKHGHEGDDDDLFG
jgi:hypothetical protein